MEALHVISPALGRCYLLYTDYVDVVYPRSVSGRHVPVAGGDCPHPSEVPILSVHVVGAGTGIVSEPNAEVLDDVRGLLCELHTLENAAIRLFNLLHLLAVVPEAGLGGHGVCSEYVHLVGRVI